MSDNFKGWAAFLMGMAALVTAISTSLRPLDTTPMKNAHDDTADIVNELSRDFRLLAKDVQRLYALRIEDEQRTKQATELVTSNDKLDELQLRRQLIAKYGIEYANDVLSRRSKLREELQAILPESETQRLEFNVTHDRKILPFEHYKKKR